MKYKGYNEWKAEGYQVRKGSRMCYRDERGVPMFSQDQVDAIEDPGDYDYEYDGSWEEMLGGYDWYK